MGNTCKNSQQESRLEMIGSFNQGLQKNMNLHKNDVPLIQYAVKSEHQPKLNAKINQVLTKQFQKQYFSEIQTLKGNQLPTFYIISKEIYYQGQWKKRLPHGKGKIYFQNGSYFEGYFNEGEAYCKNGIIIFSDGSFYRGEIQNSALEGKKGKFCSATVTYDGQWTNNKPHGFGKQIFADGNVYQGNFFEGLKEGTGTFTWNDGRVYVGQFLQGFMHGKGKYYRGNDEQFQGTFFHNKKQGKGKIQTQYGEYEGQFQDGQLTGKGIFKWNGDNERVYEGNFKNGKMHGEGNLKFSSGQMVKGIWQNGQNVRITQFLKLKSKS